MRKLVFIWNRTKQQKNKGKNITILESGIQLGDLPRHSFLASHVSDTMCVDDGSSVPSYNFIKPANMWGSFKLTFEQ